MKGTTALLVVVAALGQGCGKKEEEKKKAEEPPAAMEPAPVEKTDEPPAPAAAPKRALLVAEDGYWLAAEGAEAKKIPLDKAALAMELNLLQSSAKGTQLDLSAEDAVKYQEVITAMDTALAAGMTEVGMVGAGTLTPKLPPEGAPLPARCNDNAPGGAWPATGARAPIATLPIIVLTKDGSGTFAGPDKKKTELAAPRGCERDVPQLVELLKAGGHKAVIVQADKDATAGMIFRIVRSANAAGSTDVLFAVKPG